MTDLVTETTFDLPVPPERAWRALEEVSIRRAGSDRPDEWWFPGWESTAIEIDREMNKKLTARKALPPCEGTVIEITFEHTVSGSRVRVTQSGFDVAFVEAAGESFLIHADHIYADLRVFFETGVIAERAWRPRTLLGVTLTEELGALAVTSVVEGAWGSRVGLAAGDLLLTVHGAPLFSLREYGVIERIATTGEDVSATWVRSGRRFEASATA